jgi:hypothetical protein
LRDLSHGLLRVEFRVFFLEADRAEALLAAVE